jgi:hypothetical protein
MEAIRPLGRRILAHGCTSIEQSTRLGARDVFQDRLLRSGSKEERRAADQTGIFILVRE